MRILIISISLLYCLNIHAKDFPEIDKIVSDGISGGYFPGAQLIIGDEKNIIYEKCYGNFTYDEFSPPVTSASMYDLASVTKVVATTTAIMILYKDNKIDINDLVSKYIPEFSNSGKENIKIKNLLLHNSGLKAWIPFYKYYTTKEEVLNTIYNSGLEYAPESKCLYSDLNAVLLGIIVERVSGMGLNEFCRQNIFYPLKMESTFFLPDETARENVTPTENDTYWRMRQIKGEVHDETASILGGVSGNAGLFSNAEDLYKFMKVLLNQGKYYNAYTRGLNEEELVSSSQVMMFTKRFTDVNYANTRALGWETKPRAESSKYKIPCGELISEDCFGHTGFTGTSVWCDRERDLIIIFLTNRIYPDRNNEGIRIIRPEIHNKAIELIDSQKDFKN